MRSLGSAASPLPGAIVAAGEAEAQANAAATEAAARMKGRERRREAGAARSVDRLLRSTLRQLQLDAAVLGERLLAVAFLERLELAVAGGDEVLGRDALVGEEADDRDGAGGGRGPSWSGSGRRCR